MYRRILALALLLALALTGCAQAPASVDEACGAVTEGDRPARSSA